MNNQTAVNLANFFMLYVLSGFLTVIIGLSFGFGWVTTIFAILMLVLFVIGLLLN